MSVGGVRADAMGVRLHAECGELKAGGRKTRHRRLTLWRT